MRTEKTDVSYLKDGTNWFLLTMNCVRQAAGDVITRVEKVRLASFSASNILSQEGKFKQTAKVVLRRPKEMRSKLKLQLGKAPAVALSKHSTRCALNG